MKSTAAIFLAALAASGCAGPHTGKLPAGPDLTAEPTRRELPPDFRLQGVALSTAPAGSLDEAAVAALAVSNYPELKAARLKAGIAEAQLYAAGLLPDPRLSASLSRSSLHTGYSVGVSEEIRGLFARSSARAAALSAKDETRLEILWQEWRTAEKARALFIRARADSELEETLGAARDLLVKRYRLDQAGLQQNVDALGKVSADLAVLSSAEEKLRAAQLDADRVRHELNLLLGLAPGARPVLAGGPRNAALSREEFQAALAALPERRFDLLALRAGCRTQDKALRLAALERFPPLTVSLQKGRGAEEGVDTVGIGVEVGLPLFDGNRGRVAAERATAGLLRQAYQARLDEAVSKADETFEAARLMAGQLAELDARTADLEIVEKSAEERFRSGALGADVYVSLKVALLSAREGSIRLRAELAKARAALNALLGLP